MLYNYILKQDYLIFSGNDRLDLINRLSTNQVLNLKQNQGIKTILTTDKGRFVDLLTLYNFGELIFTICSYKNGKKVIEHLDKYTIMDDFKCKDMARVHETILFFGNDAGKFSNDVFSFDLKNTNNNDFKIFKEGDFDYLVSKNDDEFGGFIIIYPAELKNLIEEKISSAKEIYNLKNIDESEYNTMRIEYGIPSFNKEMNDSTNPLECDLTKYVNFTKGCYIGQEVIARLDTYDKISKHLVGLRFEENISKNITEDLKILSVENECGYVTSTAYSEDFGNIGLGFIKTPFLVYNKEYFTKFNEKLIKTTIHKLPFKKETK